MEESTKLTPLMQQYFAIKKDYPEGLLLFQVGDFYEMFFDDAKKASQALAITLTKRGKCQGEDIPICGVPVSSLSYYLAKLVRQGFLVVLCDQVSKPIPGEIVQREVRRVFSPGTLTEDLMLEEKKSSFLCSFWPFSDQWGILFAELLGGRILSTSFDPNDFRILESEIFRFLPDEIVLPEMESSKKIRDLLIKQGFSVSFAKPFGKTSLTDPVLADDYSLKINLELKKTFFSQLSQHLQVDFLFDQGIDQATGLLFSYLFKHNPTFFSSLDSFEKYEPSEYLLLDAATFKNLEVFRNNHDGGSVGSLISVIDGCKTGMGSRLLKQAVGFPLQNISQINARQEFVSYLTSSFWEFNCLQNLLVQFPDVGRIVGRLALGKTTVADLLNLKTSALLACDLKKILKKAVTLSKLANELFFLLDDFSNLYQFLFSALSDGCENQKIKTGFLKELDAARDFCANSGQEIVRLESVEAERTQIPGFRLKYTDIHGYFFEINPQHSNKIPSDYQLLQTLVGKNRYTSQELKNLQNKIFQAEDVVRNLEEKALGEVILNVSQELSSLRRLVKVIGLVDMLSSFANRAIEQNYVKPTFVDESILKITDGRHPVVEQFVGNSFVPNDVFFDSSQQLVILTGPNMGGKSTYLRQIAHIVLLAHIGSFVPAKSCDLGLFDRIFTRIGSADNLAAGKSTFLIEMEEVALICDQTTKKSLVILDEVGRGTSTFDGMAIAQAILEYLLAKNSAKILFATHYHELTSLADSNELVKNFFLDYRQENENIIFLHKVKAGVARSSCGIAIAKLAGLPLNLLKRAQELLRHLHQTNSVIQPANESFIFDDEMVCEELSKKAEFIEKINQIDIDNISPKDALNFLYSLQTESKCLVTSKKHK